MKVLNICYDDYANFGYENAMALKSVGVDAECVKLKAHAFEYREQAEVVSLSIMKYKILTADLVQIFHSHKLLLEVCLSVEAIRIVVYHTGTPYRNDPTGMNDFFNPHVEMCLTDQTEFIGLGMKNECYVATSIDIDYYSKFRKEVVGRPYKIGHYPSNPEVKGTDQIVDMMEKLSWDKGFVFDCSTKKLPHDQQLKRMSECDVYIELFKPELNGKPYGCFGVTAFEAAAMGKIVITQNLHSIPYKEVYGLRNVFYNVKTELDFHCAIGEVVELGEIRINDMQNAVLKIMTERHSRKPAGTRLKQILGI